MENQEVLQQILKELQSVNQRLDKLEAGQGELKDNQANIENKLDSVVEQTVDLKEFKTETNNKLDTVVEKIGAIEAVTKENLYDIAKLKLIK
ncbi:hypothetical protein U472_00315 [Orenia metallireducens]|jgi:soluble cytochrome b562|uniref:Uncharacterized protein n=1 Tax=Orenia metallireducens TaxID=1413210 RepID=A0A1C0AD95_9FIRM|nr:hypothetical protein [Orenia metallireducens]OCL28634.1 hypothetical protein U472_00315 [Orenia metallireducens]